MAKIDYIITREDKAEGGYSFTNRFEIDGKEADFGQLSADDKYIMCQGLQQSLGLLARITMIEMGVDPDQYAKDDDEADD